MIKLHSFINTFHQLWKAGETAHLDLNTHAGQAWIGIRTPLGYYGQTHPHNHNVPQTHHTHTQNPPHTPQTPTHQQHHTHTKRSPSYFRRLQRRKIDREADSTTNTNSAEKAEDTITPAEQANQTRPLIAQIHHNSTEQVEHITIPAEKAVTTTPPAEQANKTTEPTEQVGNNTTAEVEHTTTYTINNSTLNTNTTTHNTPEVTDDDIRIRYKKYSNVKQQPLSANEIACFKRICPNPTEEDIIQICKIHINERIKHTQKLQQKLT